VGGWGWEASSGWGVSSVGYVWVWLFWCCVVGCLGVWLARGACFLFDGWFGIWRGVFVFFGGFVLVRGFLGLGGVVFMVVVFVFGVL